MQREFITTRPIRNIQETSKHENKKLIPTNLKTHKGIKLTELIKQLHK